MTVLISPTFLSTLTTLALALIHLPHPATPQTTNFVDKLSKVKDLHEPGWFLENIPFIEVPSPEIEAVYYYRWSSLKRHLRYTLPGAGYIITEFVHPVGYSQKFDTINAAAGHHIDEARWLRDPRYVQDYVNLWTREGAGAQQYSEWIADSFLNFVLLWGDVPLATSQLDGLVRNFEGWAGNWEEELSLYFLSPHDDAMEHSASSEQTDDPYHGGLGYRPSFNSEMVGNARAIAEIARWKGEEGIREEYEGKAERIRAGILQHLWDKERKFFYHVFRENNPTNALLDTREEIGFFPWRWNIPPKEEEYEAAWDSLFDPLGFESEFGPTTCEQRSPWFDGNQTSNCCFWNGNSWPYSTGHTLRALASQVKNYRATPTANVRTYLASLQRYARTQYKGGKPYVAECHSPYGDFWVCDGRNHSEHYAHSTYNDNVLADLLGIEPQSDDFFQVNPLIPPEWGWFIVENVLYHGHNITVVWDRDGTKYPTTGGKGLQIFTNGELVFQSPTVGLSRVAIPPPILHPLSGHRRLENYAANVNRVGYPSPSASFTAPDCTPWQGVDGRVFYDPIPSNRWSNYGSTSINGDWFAVDFGPGRNKNVSQVKLYIYSDWATGGDVDCPASINVEYMGGSGWVSVADQVLSPPSCQPNDVWTVDFSPISTQEIRVVFQNNLGQGTWVGFTEMEIWAPWPQSGEEMYEFEDGLLLNTVAAVVGSTNASGGSFIAAPRTSSLELTGLYAPREGNYLVRVYYALSSGNDGILDVDVNFAQSHRYFVPPTNSPGGEFPPGNVWELELPLQSGHNVLHFEVYSGNFDFDRLSIVSV